MEDFEKLGAFYLGCDYDPSTRRMGALRLQDSRDLTTHAVVIGMTGSGKTGLGIALLEEAAMDGIPVIAIDPKGDIGNLLLSFPGLDASSFRPWINESDAERKGMDPDSFARGEAERWQKGLAEWGQPIDRVARLREKADFAIYTPGAPSGRPLSILRSYDAPAPHVLEDPSELADRIRNAVSGLLGLLGIEADPLQSREHILLSAIFLNAWSAARSLDLPTIVESIRKPPFTRLGVMDVETFYPSKARFELALRLNGLLASPGFQAWVTGEPLDVASLLRSEDGRPRVSVLSIAHLPDSERMFFVTILLNEVLSWMKSQPGTTSLRAILYMDEIFGYFPPTAAPPSKAPMLTLLKQARAFGLGLVLATQNPVDLDYKGLSNAGTWFIGRLQTERDKARVLEALEGSLTAESHLTRKDLDTILSGLAQRSFLLHSVHEDRPSVFVTRWTMSYLRGPLTLAQARILAESARRESASRMAPRSGPPPLPGLAPPPPPGPFTSSAYGPRQSPAPGIARSTVNSRPVLPPGITQLFLPLMPQGAPSGETTYLPAILGVARVRTVQDRVALDHSRTVCRLASLEASALSLDWDQSDEFALEPGSLLREPEPGVGFQECPSEASNPSNYPRWSKALAKSLQRTGGLELYESKKYKMLSRPGESLQAFMLRLDQSRREARDEAVRKVRDRYATRLGSLQDKLRRAEARVDEQSSQASQKKLETAVSMSLGMLGSFFGRRSIATSAGQAIRNAGRAAKEGKDVSRARDEVDVLQAQIEEMEEKLRAEAEAIEQGSGDTPEAVQIKPRSSDVTVEHVALLWVPQVRGR